MPIYAYRCDSCGVRKDVLQKVSDAPLTVCTECGAGWLHATGVALVDNRVVAVNVSWIGDLETIVGDDDPAPVSRLLDRAIQQAGG